MKLGSFQDDQCEFSDPSGTSVPVPLQKRPDRWPQLTGVDRDIRPSVCCSASPPLHPPIRRAAFPALGHRGVSSFRLRLFQGYNTLTESSCRVVAPITEELVYRGWMVPLLYRSLGWTATILILPFFFGVAHLHCTHMSLGRTEQDW